MQIIQYLHSMTWLASPFWNFVKHNTRIEIPLTQINTKVEELVSVHLIYHSVWPKIDIKYTLRPG
jgi:hypothetical protein